MLSVLSTIKNVPFLGLFSLFDILRRKTKVHSWPDFDYNYTIVLATDSKTNCCCDPPVKSEKSLCWRSIIDQVTTSRSQQQVIPG